MMNRPSCAALCAAVLAPCAIAQAQTPTLTPPPAQLPAVTIRASDAPDETRQELEAERALTPQARLCTNNKDTFDGHLVCLSVQKSDETT